MTDKKTLDLAREWAERAKGLNSLKPEWEAAIDVILSLPGTIIDGEKLREVINGHWADCEGDLLKDHLEALLPAPTPRTLADMSPAERKECVGMWCDNLVSTAEEPRPVVLSCVQGETCWVMHTTIHGEQSGFSLDAVAPRFDLRRAWTPSGEPVVEDTPEPELEQVAEADPAYIYTDRDGDEWEHIDGRWAIGGTHSRRVFSRDIGDGGDNLPEEYEPYTRIEDKTNDH